jgi:hypothetical protein
MNRKDHDQHDDQRDNRRDDEHDDARDGQPDDRALDAFLRGEDELAGALRGLDQPAPPPALDARIRAQAREALAEPAGAANDAVDAEERALVASPLGRWRAPLAVAATVVIGASLALQWDGGSRDAARAPLADTAPRGAAGSAPSAPAAAPETAQPAPVQRDAATPAAAPSAASSAAAAAPVAARPQRHAAAGPAPAEAEALAPPPAPPAVAAPPAPMPIMPAPSFPAQYYAAPPAGADEAPVQRRNLAPTHVDVTGSRVTASDERRPREWLAVLGQLLDHRLDDDARTSWDQFRRQYPDYPVPDALRQRLDALPATP